MSPKGAKPMATERHGKPVKGLENLTAKKRSVKEDSQVKAGYIGETEKLKGSVSSINRGDGIQR
jgi:hypothetical protein